MLFFYQSNRLECLGQLFCQMAKHAPLSDAFAPETVIVQNRGMRCWLALELAQQTGVAANIDWMQPTSFAWRLMQTLMPGVSRPSMFSPDALLWRIMEWLLSARGAAFLPLKRYVQRGESACFDLAGKVAALFEHYLVFRPDWIRAWEVGRRVGLGENEAWQASLWQHLAQSSDELHPVRMLDILSTQLMPEQLPERITLFGISSLAPLYLELIQRLAQLTQVCLFILNPCKAYWGDIVATRHKLQEDSFSMVGHPLLASLGKQGRDFFEQIIEETEWDAVPLFEVPSRDLLLHRLQRDIVELSPPQRLRLADDDDSIQVHVVHGPMRELEVLKDRLLALFVRYPELTPADVAVLTPDIDAYTPYIDAVFAQRLPPLPSIPYRIAGRHLMQEEPLLKSICACLDLLDSRFAADQVLALLETPAILRRFGLSEADVSLIRQWINASGIRWGRDAAHKAALGLPADPTFTWRWGLDRLLLGSVLPVSLAGYESGVFAGLLPHNAVQGQLSETLARFSLYFDVLDQLAQDWAQPALPAQWILRLQQGLEEIFAPDRNEEKAYYTMRKILSDWLEQTIGFNCPISLAMVRDWLKQRLNQASSLGFLSGGVTFCAIAPMRAIPFKVICLIGLNDGCYPCDERTLSFDLLAKYPKRGDQSRRMDDRYLFMETILSARQVLYLSYIGQSSRTGELLPPSTLLSELLDCLATMCDENDQTRLVTRHPLQPFSALAYDNQHLHCASFEPVFAEALAQPPRVPQPFVTTLPNFDSGSSMTWQAFVRFWRHPVRAWLADRLGLHLYTEAKTVFSREPFAVDDVRCLRVPLVQALLQDRPLQPVLQRLRASAHLPSDELGAAWLEAEMAASVKLAERLPVALKQAPLPLQPFILEIADCTLVGELSSLRPQGRLDYSVGRLYTAQKVDWWLNHLLLCCIQPEGILPYSAYYDEADGLVLDTIAPDTARALLTSWVEYWRQGQQQALPWFGRTSWAYAETWYKTPDRPDKAMQQALNKWAPAFRYGHSITAQQNEAEIALVFRYRQPLEEPLFTELALALLVPLIRHQAEQQVA